MPKRKLSKAFQIAGLRKALANRKTPKQFLPSMRKRLAKLTAAVAILFFLFGCAAQVKAQGQVFTIPQTVTQVLAPAGTACTGAAQTYNVQNLGQTQHYIYYVGSAFTVTNMSIQIYGVDGTGNSYLISDAAKISFSAAGQNPVLSATGYYPIIKVVVVCNPATTGTYQLNYTGTSSTSNLNTGGYQITQSDKVISSGMSAGATFADGSFNTPFGSSLGSLNFNYFATGPAGSSITVACGNTSRPGTGGTTFVYAIQSTAVGTQAFIVPDTDCPNMAVTYTSGGASASTYSLEYDFPQPTLKLSNAYAHVTGTTATIVKPGPGVVQTVVVGTPVTGTISLFDLTPAACTATPVTGVVSVLNETAANPPVSIPFGSLFLLGICAKASVASDFTVVYQ